MLKRRNPRVLYVAYWGLLEPLGQSLILPSIRRLARLGADLTLITFEKPRDTESPERVAALRCSLRELGVRWIPLGYHKRPKVPATFFDIAHGLIRAVLSGLRSRPDVVHARTYVGGLIGLALAPVLGARLVYHNEGFYPDEQVDSGVWAQGSLPHRVAKRLELKMYARADGIVALSHRAKREIEDIGEVKRKRTPVIVVPSCVDLDHFSMRPSEGDPDGVLRLVYLGSIGGRYEFDKAARLVAVAARNGIPVHLSILSGADRGLVLSILNNAGVPDDASSLDSVPHTEIPGQLARSHAGMLFLTGGISEHGCSPTKLGEYWAAGLPVITTPNISDTDEIIASDRVGVIVRNYTDSDYLRAVEELLLLLQDAETPRRCRRAAETHYRLSAACESQMALYYDLIPGAALNQARAPRSSPSEQ